MAVCTKIGRNAAPRKLTPFLVRAPDSSSDYAPAAAAGGATSSFGEHASMGKGTYIYDSSKEPQ